MFDDEDEEDDDGKQRVELREDSITLDQVRSFVYPVTFVLRRRVSRPGESRCRAHGEVLGLRPSTQASQVYLHFSTSHTQSVVAAATRFFNILHV